MRTNRPAHGGANIAELRSLGMRPEDVLDFSASINPLGAPPAATLAVNSVDLAAYPDTECTALREALADHLDVSPKEILVGNGSTELIHLTARAYLMQPVRSEPVQALQPTALIFTPAFGEFEAACAMQNARIIGIAANEGDRFSWDIDSAVRTIAEQSPSLVFLCNPNNPTGRYMSEEDVREIAGALPQDSLLLLDEAYLPFVDFRWNSLPLLELGNVALMRSMTKDYALTALRLGYMLAPPDIVQHVRAQQHSWSVNALAQSAGIAALADTVHVEDGRREVQKAKRYLINELAVLGLQFVPSAANFLLVNVSNAKELRYILLKRHRVIVRDCASFGLPDYIRIGIRTKEDCKRLVAALRDTLV
jgi:histidinol-phosphate aminotransferase